MLNDLQRMFIGLFLGGTSMYLFMINVIVLSSSLFFTLIGCEYVWMIQDEDMHFQLPSNKG